MSWLFFAVSLWGAYFTWNAFRPVQRLGPLAVMSFFAGWLTAELALHHIAWQAIATVVFIVLGALDAWPGQVGLAITLLSWVGLWVVFRQGHRADLRIEGALMEGLGDDYLSALDPELARPFRERIRPSWLAMPFPVRHPEVTTTRNVVFHEVDGIRLKLDIYQRTDGASSHAPILVYVHGGAWIIGYRRYQGLPLLHHMAAVGWLCISVGYRRSPRGTFPDHLVDVKRALAWIHEHAEEYGGDPSRIAIAGNSAGGHLAALAALTPNVARFQPGFEAVDTSVVACMPFYGVYDFTDRFGHWKGKHRDMRLLLERMVFKRKMSEAPELFEEASPMHWVNEDAPPFFIFHGDKDSLVPVEEARRFSVMLADVSQAPVCYAEIPGAQHAYEVFPSIRTGHTLLGAERFLTYCLRDT